MSSRRDPGPPAAPGTGGTGGTGGARQATVGPMLRGLVRPVLLPVVVTEMGNGAALPVVAITAKHFGASTGVAALMVAMLGIGQLVGDVPSAILAERWGDRRAMLVAATVSGVAYCACLVSGSLPLLGAGLLAAGAVNATFYLARQSYVIETVPVSLRARAMSTLGGSHRIGLFLGPLVGAGTTAAWGVRGAYALAVATNLLAVAVLLATRPDPTGAGAATAARRAPDPGAGSVLRRHAMLFATLGTAIVAVGAVRAARQTAVPLWAVHLGLGPARTSLVFAIASCVDMTLFYPAGKVMDSLGRLAVAVPSMAILGAMLVVLPLTGGIVSLTLVAMAMSFGNGIGSGIMMTLGADTAPEAGRLRFLGVWRFLSDTGNAGGPLLVSVTAALTTLAAGIVAVGLVGLVAVVSLLVWVPRYSAHAVRRRPRAT